MPLGRILPRPSGTVPTQPASLRSARGPACPGSASASTARAAHGLAQLGRCKRARGGATRLCCGGDLTGAREAAEESTVGPHRRVDSGVGRHGGSAMTYEDGGGEG
jgi:hypothetical protein